MQNTKYLTMKYRRDIDGLRAMAIMAVVLYHAFPKHFKGGFIGVDIFFVISGYLISFILFKNFEVNNFCLYSFYAKRIKRIFPALIIVTTFSIVFGWFALTDTEYMLLAKHARSSVLFISNFILAKEAGYFDVSSHTKPLMHLWSLSIEEQFYIIWPLLLYFIIKKRLNVLSFSIGFIAISFFTGINMLSKNTVNAFYFPWCRFWELLSGAVLAYIVCNKVKIVDHIQDLANHWLNVIIYKHHSSYSNNTLKNTAAFVGIIINLLCIIFLKKTHSFPGWYAILPVVGTLLIIAAGESAYINNKILSNKLCVGLGLISYPLYLWHWSLLSFAFIIEGSKLTINFTLIILLISFVLSWLTYRFIEKPVRSSDSRKLVVVILVTLLVSTGLCAHSIIINKGYDFRGVNLSNKIPSLPNNDDRFLRLQINCFSPFAKSDKKEIASMACLSNTAQPKFLAIGDSHVLSFAYSALIHDHLDIAVAYLSGTPAMMNYFTFHRPTQKREERVEAVNLYNQSLNNFLTDYNSIEYVILVSRGPVYFSNKGFGVEEKDEALNNWEIESIKESKMPFSKSDAFVNGYVEMIKFLLSKGKKVIFMIDYPELGIDPALCFKRLFSLSKNEKHSCLLDKTIVDTRQKEYRELVTRIQEQVPSLIIYDALPAFCDKDICYGKKNNVIYYGDDDHLNIVGSDILIRHFKNWLTVQGLMP